ncbi:MAG: radical SAM protein [Smithella sp.]|jgi:MoaA/NifB/PqqE/SkfB family radical SAM enzyme
MIKEIPRLPLEGYIDLTDRCNNNCLHCWLSLPANAPDKKNELTFDEIRRIVDDARAMGCRSWIISGGEPLLRPDFPEIFDYLTRKAVSYSINTNGTLITPEIARWLTCKGTKMISLYGATAEVYDNVTRNPGGFEKVMRGFEYLKEAGASFIVQLVPMRSNYHQWKDMIALAQSLSKHWRCGASWLYLSYDGSKQRNKAIQEQRLSPADIINLEKPDPTYDERTAELEKRAYEIKWKNQIDAACGAHDEDDNRLFARCIAGRRKFHIDPYGRMSWCSFIKDNALRYDLRKGSFAEAWDTFIPSCADKVCGGDEWRKNCCYCESRNDCRWCAAYAYIETGRYSAPLPYLCAIAKEARKFKEDWQKNHRRYFRIAGITARIESDLDFSRIKFKDELMAFSVEGSGEDNVEFRHHFELPDLEGRNLGKELYRKPPWAISRDKDGTWFYLGISPEKEDESLHRVAIFSADHVHGTIYSPPDDLDRILTDGWQSISLFPTDQIWLGPLLADRNAVLMHSAAAIVNSKGLVFVGHSEAGKSTTIELLKAANREGKLSAEILCDDRNILRYWPDKTTGQKPTSARVKGGKRNGNGRWLVHGTWSHGTTADVSPSSAPLCAILFLKQDRKNKIEPLTDRKKIWHNLLATLIRPMVTAEWWQKELDILERIVHEIPCYTMHFDKSGAIAEEIIRLKTEGD